MPYSIAVRLSLAMIFLLKFETNQRIFSTTVCVKLLPDILINTERTGWDSAFKRELAAIYIYAPQLYVCIWSYYCDLIIACRFLYHHHWRASFTARIYLSNSPIYSHFAIAPSCCVIPSQKYTVLSELVNRFMQYMQFCFTFLLLQSILRPQLELLSRSNMT